MAKKKDSGVEVPEAEEVDEITLPKTFDKNAYSILQKDGEYHLVRISYNAKLEVGSAMIIESGSDHFDIEYAFEQASENMVYD